MGLSIKNQATEDTIRKLAAQMGVSLTEAIDRAVDWKLWELTHEETVQKDVDALLQIARASALRFGDEEKTFKWDGFLHDENGQPK